MLDILREEIEIALAFTGNTTPDALTPSVLASSVPGSSRPLERV